MAEKTEAPTPRRLQEARERGQVMHSIEINAAVGLLAAAMLLQGPGRQLYNAFYDLFGTLVAGLSMTEVNDAWLGHFIYLQGAKVFLPMMQIVLVLMAVGVVSNLAQVGFVWASKRNPFDVSRLNPLNGLKRLFSIEGLANLLKSLLKLTLIGWVAFGFLRSNVDKFYSLAQMDLRSGVTIWGGLALALVWRVAIAFLILAVADYVYQRWQFMRNMRMTKEELKEEFKSTEGDPTIKSRIKQQQQRMARARMMAAVPKADVVITNPVHYAVAVQYEAETMSAPRVLAKGAELVARRIVELAKSNDVPVVQNVPLARAMYRLVDIGQEIPPELYLAMAEVLAYVYRIKPQRSQSSIVSEGFVSR